MRVREMNHVNLIGQISSDPQFVKLKSGRKVAKFSLSTKEIYLDADGEAQSVRNWHKITAWGKWVPILEKLGTKGMSLAIEGRLRSRFFQLKGERRISTEVEINDMVIL